ncbi:hypothetical protein [Clostridium polynesiense]|uniref:hypothetical protein n=1 Tax=Clostridium polynesiense TaxID=1325933 RepID=UPI000B13CA47|nr:hypothetical protein [Clostridium polynesiense]
MKKHQRKNDKHDFLRNGSKTQNQWAKNHLPQGIEEPALNESGKKFKEEGFY